MATSDSAFAIRPVPPPVVGPPASPWSITLRRVTWASDCQILDVEANNHDRISYLGGVLTLVAPVLRHEGFAALLGHVVCGVAWASERKFRSIGATTLRCPVGQEGFCVGKEADTAFDLGPDEQRMRGRWEIDLGVDPPPSLALKTDHTGESAASLALYAQLGVPEVWPFVVARQALRIDRRDRRAYHPVDYSNALPCLTPEWIMAALDPLDEMGLDASDWLEWLREWAGALPDA